ncbi:amidohydrolase [Gemmatimonadota bacterium]
MILKKLSRMTSLAIISNVTLGTSAILAGDIDKDVQKMLPELVSFYKYTHSHPELSYYEKETSERLATELEKIGFEVTTPIGKYPDLNLISYGVVAVMKNGSGPVVLVRSDIDALPILEKTGVDYASTMKQTGESGKQEPVMHACGHDMHQTILLGTARLLTEMKERWSGTLILIGQPAEERGGGVRAMLAGGLYEKWPVPDYALAEHVDPSLEAGQVGYCPGFAMASIDMVDITIYGVGAHGARPHQGIDPIVIASQIVNSLQTLVSRSINPVETGVVTVGSFHGGSKHNIISDEVNLQLTVRSFKEDVRKILLDGIERIAANTARANGMPEDRLPVIHNRKQEFFPVLYNDPQLVERSVKAFKSSLGEDRVIRILPTTGGEDFSEFGRTEHKVPIFLYRVGTAPPGSEPNNRPGLHSALFIPEVEPTISTGVTSMTAAVLELMGR